MSDSALITNVFDTSALNVMRLEYLKGLVWRSLSKALLSVLSLAVVMWLVTRDSFFSGDTLPVECFLLQASLLIVNYFYLFIF